MKKGFAFVFALLIITSGCHIVIEEPYSPIYEIAGFYDVDEWSETVGIEDYYEVEVYRDRHNHNGIIIENFYNAGIRVFAELNGSRIRIPYQVSGNYEIEGYGTFYGDELELSYTVSDIHGYYFQDVCNAYFIKY